MKVKLDLFNYEIKADFKGTKTVTTSNLVPNPDLANLKIVLDIIDIDELKPALADLYKLRNVVDNNVVKKLCMVNWSQMLILFRYQVPGYQSLSDSDKQNFEKMIEDVNKTIPNTNGLVRKSDYNLKMKGNSKQDTQCYWFIDQYCSLCKSYRN